MTFARLTSESVASSRDPWPESMVSSHSFISCSTEATSPTHYWANQWPSQMKKRQPITESLVSDKSISNWDYIRKCFRASKTQKTLQFRQVTQVSSRTVSTMQSHEAVLTSFFLNSPPFWKATRQRFQVHISGTSPYDKTTRQSAQGSSRTVSVVQS